MSNHQRDLTSQQQNSTQSSLTYDQSLDQDSIGSLPMYLQSPGTNSSARGSTFPSRNDSAMSSMGFGDGSARTEADDSAITINANNVSSYNHAYIKALSESSELEQESKDQVVPLDSIRNQVSTKTVANELRHRSRESAMSQASKTKSVQEIMDSGKRSNAIDLETGKLGGSRSQCAVIREEYEREPQSRRSRGLKKILKKLARPFRPTREGTSDSQRPMTKKAKYKDGNRISRRTVSIPCGDDTQYQIFSVDESVGKGMKGIGADRSDKSKLLGLFSPEQMVTSYLFWAFRSSFLAVLASAALWFAIITFGFGLLLFFLAHRAPKCVHIAGEDFDGLFMDAYSLSWTTFTTVGYGAVFPGTTATAEDVNDCWAVTFLSTLESFVGILFASFWGAIFLSKVTRVSSSAQVTFSDPVLIRFGQGVKGTHSNESDSSSSDSENDMGSHLIASYPCPILEFRLINKLSGQRKGEIIDATLNMVASVDSAQVSSMGNNNNRKKKKGKKGKGRKTSGAGAYRQLDDYDGRPSEAELLKLKQKIRKVLINTNRSASTMDEKNDPKVANRREFAKLFVESQDHPFFKRVWVAKHILDQDSPLLINDAKDLIRLNGGRWPAELNSAAAVRACVKFDSILVSLSGTSNADANTVYAQKVYDYSNVVVGYRFCNILYREPDGSLGVDALLLNDVNEQAGGGGEELDDRMRFSFRKSKVDILIL